MKTSRKRQSRKDTAAKDTGSKWELGVIDGLLSEVVNSVKTGYINSVGFSSTSLRAHKRKSQAFDKTEATLPFNIHTSLEKALNKRDSV